VGSEMCIRDSTLDTYSHVLPNLQEEATRDLDAWLAGQA